MDTAAKLDAIRYDLDGDLSPESNAAAYTAAFGNISCPAGAVCMGYQLTSDIDLSSHNGGEWGPIGSGRYGERFEGVFDGGGNTISNLMVNQPDGGYLGLFGAAAKQSMIRNLTLDEVNVTGLHYVGGLVGLNAGIISNVRVEGAEIEGDNYVGGLVGSNHGGVSLSSASGGLPATPKSADSSASTTGPKASPTFARPTTAR